MAMKIRTDDLTGLEIALLLSEHVQSIAAVCPPETRYALDLQGLQDPRVTVWSVWEGPDLLGCGALKGLTPLHGEIKSMCTASKHQRRGVATALLRHIINEARRRGFARLSLETGSAPYFAAARNLYRKMGFEFCPPFADYKEDISSVFMSMSL